MNISKNLFSSLNKISKNFIISVLVCCIMMNIFEIIGIMKLIILNFVVITYFQLSIYAH
ncbi:hypothetical protein HNQ03_002686 [Chryseobacterium sp. 16F]|uniref:Uncharacterized protein n=1 Tax=Frigoriflavimonas asaccharolytica TaxID=2735899 RepID=A0A8J8GCU1_9FLAO|nr:hypothetical protein [Frigoriflavimonas asaccharolytica]